MFIGPFFIMVESFVPPFNFGVSAFEHLKTIVDMDLISNYVSCEVFILFDLNNDFIIFISMQSFKVGGCLEDLNIGELFLFRLLLVLVIQ